MVRPESYAIDTSKAGTERFDERCEALGERGWVAVESREIYLESAHNCIGAAIFADADKKAESAESMDADTSDL